MAILFKNSTARRVSLLLIAAAAPIASCAPAQQREATGEIATKTAPIASDTPETPFKDALPLDEKLWASDFAVRPLDTSQPPPPRFRRLKFAFRSGKDGRLGKTPSGMCAAFDRSIAMYGGVWQPGCSAVPLHPQSPDADRFGEPLWKSVDPAANVDVVRDFELAICAQQNAFDDATGRRGLTGRICWPQKAAGYQRIIDQGRLLIQQAIVDIDNDGVPDEIFRFAIDKVDDCFSSAGSGDHFWTFAMRGASERATWFNRRSQRGSLFTYSGQSDDHTFIWNTSGSIHAGHTSADEHYVDALSCSWTWDFTQQNR